MTDTETVQYRSDMTVQLVDSMGSDDSIIKAMLVSTQGADSLDATASEGRINFLMKNRHGSPLEHTAMTFYVEAPIFVFREWHRHRIASYNELSGRYSQLPPMFYIPAPERPLIQVGKPGAYEFVPGSEDQYTEQAKIMRQAYRYSYKVYTESLANGIAKEVARMVLPVSIYSAMYVTVNIRALMGFLSLRTKHKDSMFPSYPMREIEMCAEQVEELFKEQFPLTHAAFERNGRVG
jgi:thymidylate synthase (FAD)